MRSPLGKYSNHIHFRFKGFNFLLHMLCIPQSFTMALLSIPFPRNGEAVLLEIYFQSLSSTTYYITSPFLKSSSCFLTSTVLNFQGFFFFLLLLTAPATYGSSQARDQIRATAASLHCSHTNTGSEPHLEPML